MSLRCALGKLVGQVPATEEELRAIRAAAWHKQGILVVNAEALRDEWERQCLTNIGIVQTEARPPGTHGTCCPTVCVRRRHQYYATRFEDARAFRQQCFCITQVLDNFDQRDGVK